MTTLTSLFDWQMLLLLSPSAISLVISAYLLWSDAKFRKQQEEQN